MSRPGCNGSACPPMLAHRSFARWHARHLSEPLPLPSVGHRRERVVHSLLEKLQPDMITLDLDAFGVMDKNSAVCQCNATNKTRRECDKTRREFA